MKTEILKPTFRALVECLTKAVTLGCITPDAARVQITAINQVAVCMPEYDGQDLSKINMPAFKSQARGALVFSNMTEGTAKTYLQRFNRALKYYMENAGAVGEAKESTPNNQILMPIKINIRQNLVVTVSGVPDNLNASEAKRINKIIDAYVFEGDSCK
jgi:hypothetical protein